MMMSTGSWTLDECERPPERQATHLPDVCIDQCGKFTAQMPSRMQLCLSCLTHMGARLTSHCVVHLHSLHLHQRRSLKPCTRLPGSVAGAEPHGMHMVPRSACQSQPSHQSRSCQQLCEMCHLSLLPLHGAPLSPRAARTMALHLLAHGPLDVALRVRRRGSGRRIDGLLAGAAHVLAGAFAGAVGRRYAAEQRQVTERRCRLLRLQR